MKVYLFKIFKNKFNKINKNKKFNKNKNNLCKKINIEISQLI